jgi:hypothetical protein
MSSEIPEVPQEHGEVDREKGFSLDYVNAWIKVKSYLRMLDNKQIIAPQDIQEMREKLRHVDTYSDYISGKYKEEDAKRILGETKPDMLEFLDNFAEEYNQEIDRILETEDREKLSDYVRAISDLAGPKLRF